MVEPENRRPKSDDPWLRVPASARPAGRYRFEDQSDDEADEDVEFLQEIAQQAAQVPHIEPELRPVTAARFSIPADDALDLFRTTEVERPRPRVLSQIRVDEVEMDDLLGQLSTTAAALRRRKAA